MDHHQEEEEVPEASPEDFGSDDEGEGQMPGDTEAVIGQEIDISGDKKLTKVITQAGKGWECPPVGSEVTVHYVGTLEDGTPFDSSRDRGEPFVFKLGQGQVIKGWDQGVKTMKKGERAVLKCDPDYAYGANGSPPKIPANSTLNFDVELLSWTEWKDISKNGSLWKKVVAEGVGYETAEFDSVVNLSWKLYLEGSEKILEEKVDMKATIGSDELPAALEKVVESMKKNEHCLVKIMDYTSENKDLVIPQGSTCIYDVTLTSFEGPPKSWKLEGAEKITLAKTRRDEGGDLFRNGHIERAIKKYKAGLDFVTSDYKMSDAEKEDAKTLKLAFHLNLAACDIRKCNWSEVIEHANKALETQPGNAKALLRRGKAYNEQDRWVESKSDLTAVIEKDTAEAADAKKELQKLTKKIKDQESKEKKLYGNMFDRMRHLKDDKVDLDPIKQQQQEESIQSE